MPASRIAAISSEVATGRRINGREGFTACLPLGPIGPRSLDIDFAAVSQLVYPIHDYPVRPGSMPVSMATFSPSVGPSLTGRTVTVSSDLTT